MPLVYKGLTLECGFRADFIVESVVVVELKAVDKVVPIHEAQLITHLRLTGLRVGLLFNFCEVRLMDGFKRRVL
jgi:GxxExxY protein